MVRLSYLRNTRDKTKEPAMVNNSLYCSYLWNTRDDTKEPSDGQHQFASSVGIVEVDGMCDGEVAIKADGGENEGRQIEAECAEEHEHATRDIANVPRHCHVPADLQRHHDERHQ